MKFDFNQDGSFTNNEITEELKKATLDVSTDTAANFAPFTLIPVSLFIGLVVYIIRKKV